MHDVSWGMKYYSLSLNPTVDSHRHEHFVNNTGTYKYPRANRKPYESWISCVSMSAFHTNFIRRNAESIAVFLSLPFLFAARFPFKIVRVKQNKVVLNITY